MLPDASVIPDILSSDLYRAGWNGCTAAYPDINYSQFAMMSLYNSILKKFEGAESSDADARAQALFMQINDACGLYRPEQLVLTTVENDMLCDARHFLACIFDRQVIGSSESCALSLRSIALAFGVGSGASIGSENSDFYTKFANSRLSCTDRALYDLYTEAISLNRLWSEVEFIRSSLHSLEVVKGSRLSFVPKTRAISRTICTEPLLNMIFQKGIGTVLENLLRKKVGISLSTQPDKNRALARIGSESGEFGTIDLSSASDSISLTLVDFLLPRHVLYWLKLSRSPVTVLPDGKEVKLHMVSSMGNAYTFPLQTMIFASLVYAVYRALGIPFQRPYGQSLGNFAVFGDDIIVRKKAYGPLCNLLNLCGFRVNVDKSFNEGAFRESCGHDYFSGRDVRGVYIKTLKDVTDVYSAINRLNYWSSKHCIGLTSTVPYILGKNRFLPVPPDEQDTAGVKVPLRSLKHRTLDPLTGGIYYRYIHIERLSYDVQDVEAKVPSLKGFQLNPAGLVFSAVAGYLRGGCISLRIIRKRTRVKRRSSSRWDYIAPDLRVSEDFGRRWKSFVELNLSLY